MAPTQTDMTGVVSRYDRLVGLTSWTGLTDRWGWLPLASLTGCFNRFGRFSKGCCESPTNTCPCGTLLG
jgi:hypothetical protein